MTCIRRLLSTALAVVVLGGTIQAQTLGDIARKEEERRKTVSTPGRVYTNDTLPAVPPPATPAEEPDPATRPAGEPGSGRAEGTGTPETAPAEGAAGEPAGVERGEAYWRDRITKHRDALRRSAMFAEALQTRINALTADFTARDDPAQREVIALDRQRALAELDRVREERAEETKALAATEEEARRAGVPPGWLR
jgi:hypothetical protein